MPTSGTSGTEMAPAPSDSRRLLLIAPCRDEAAYMRRTLDSVSRIDTIAHIPTPILTRLPRKNNPDSVVPKALPPAQTLCLRPLAQCAATTAGLCALAHPHNTADVDVWSRRQS